ncbi:MAG: AMP-binding protein, partial [Gammaproteobacteria bacterium]|nr:AMP-binding protein [Gammaproteobacteria bacterium]
MNSVQLEDQQAYYFPMSFAQQRLWLFQQMHPESTAYNITGALRLSGNLDVVALEQALQKIVRRHEILRTTFREVQGESSQWVQAGSSLLLEQQVLAEASLGEQFQTCRQIAARLATHVFDLQVDPLIKLQLLTLSKDEYVLISVVHHIISDGWSMGVFIDELMKFYMACQQDKPVTGLPELEIQYGDYALWQCDWFSGDVRARQMDYWQKQLAGMPSLLSLPNDYPRPPVQRFQGATKTIQLPATTTAALKVLANQENATLNMVLLTVYFILLHRYNQEQDLVVGTPVANRNQHELEPLIGFFANTLVLRVQIESHVSFSLLLQQVKATALAAFEHQDCPFEQLVDQLRPERSLSYSALIQTLFTFQAASEQVFKLTDVSISHLQLERENAQFDLALMASENANDISLEFGYNTDLFKSATIDVMAQHFVNLCRAVSIDSGLTCGSIPLMEKSEYHNVLNAWNQSSRVELDESSVMFAIDRQAQLQPNAMAVVCNQQSLTYAELIQQSEKIARLLVSSGVCQGDLIGLCIEPGLQMLVALLGIIKAGAAYVPMDPYYPEHRLKLIAETAGIRSIVSQKELTVTLSTFQSDVQFSLYFIEDLLYAEPIQTCLPVIQGEQLMYMIFTSGSTGIPKGAAVQHQSFANLVLNWYVSEYALSEVKSTLVCSSLSFDLTQKNFFAPLAIGGTLYLYGQREYDPLTIVNLIHRYEIGWINTTPSAFYPLADAARVQPELLESLKYVFLGGETISLRRMQPWLDAAKHSTQIINSYGPTECTDV